MDGGLELERNILLKKFWELDIKTNSIGLCEWGNDGVTYFCTPVGAEIISGLGVDGIHFCFVPSVDENMVFLVSPMLCGVHYVEPVAHSFTDFLSLILACGDACLLEPISWLNETKFNELLQSESENFIEEKDDALEKIKNSFNIEPCPDSYHYVKEIQTNFNYSLIPYGDEYYGLLGI